MSLLPVTEAHSNTHMLTYDMVGPVQASLKQIRTEGGYVISWQDLWDWAGGKYLQKRSPKVSMIGILGKGPALAQRNREKSHS